MTRRAKILMANWIRKRYIRMYWILRILKKDWHQRTPRIGVFIIWKILLRYKVRLQKCWHKLSVF